MKSLRESLSSITLVLGCCVYLASNLIGRGWELQPNPMEGLLIAAAGIMLCGFALALTPYAESRRDVFAILKAVLVLGGFSLLATGGSAAVCPFYDIANARWGAIPPPGIIFGSCYGVISFAGLLAIDLWEQEHQQAPASVR